MVDVEIAAVNKLYGTTSVLDDVTARFAAGGLTTLLGPSGSGKTTLLRIVAGFVPPSSGRIRFGGADVTDEPVWRRNVGMVFQSYALFPHMSVRDNVLFGLHRRGVRGEAARRELRRALELVQLTGFDERRPKQLSGGQQQRVALARAIVTRPRVLLLDEPLSALDRRLRQGMQIELRRIQRESGLTTIFVTHDQEEALTLSDEIAILDRGRLVQRGAPADIYEHPRSRFAATFLGDANFFTGRAVRGGIELGGHLLRAREVLPDAPAATLAVRPEKIAIAASGSGAEDMNHLPATLRAVVYAGPISTLLLASDDGTEIRLLHQNRDGTGPSPGTRIVLAWSPRDTIPIPD